MVVRPNKYRPNPSVKKTPLQPQLNPPRNNSIPSNVSVPGETEDVTNLTEGTDMLCPSSSQHSTLTTNSFRTASVPIDYNDMMKANYVWDSLKQTKSDLVMLLFWH